MTKGEDTRQRIVVLAAPIFNRRGYEGASMREILDATGLEKGGLYRHFASKEDLAAEVFRYEREQSVKTRTDGMDHIAGARAKIEFFIRRFVETPSPIEGGCPLLNTAVDADDGNPRLRRLVRDAFLDWKNRLGAIVSEAIRAGEFSATVDSRQLAGTIIAALEGGLVLARIEGSRQPLYDVQNSLTMLLGSLAAPTTTARSNRRSERKARTRKSV